MRRREASRLSPIKKKSKNDKGNNLEFKFAIFWDFSSPRIYDKNDESN